ncbi:MAG TPA: cellulase family glycosylhydrolase [Ktedonobacteraceae bacterium]|nr:cellulase family glycosylhydrolase [Ktedonobacteraceae bacterium]
MTHRITHPTRVVTLMVLVLVTGFIGVFNWTPRNAQAACINPPHVKGVNIIRCDGTTIYLRGASQPSAYNFQSDWTNSTKSDPNAAGNPLNPTTLSVMANTWLMNAIRIPVSAYIYNEINNPVCGGSCQSLYLSRLSTTVTNATSNTNKLYVIFALFDDGQANDPTANGMLTLDDVNFLGTLATTFASNSRVLGFDTINEPNGYTSWSQWLNGDHVNGIYGQQDAVNAIRNTGAKQIIVLESGKNAGGGVRCTDGAGYHHDGGWNGWSSTYLPSDSQKALMFSKHDYSDVVADRSDIVPCQLGSLNGSSGPYGVWPTYMGEWAGLAHPLYPSDCQADGNILSSSNADQYVTDWMNNLQTANNGSPVNWTGWDFRNYEMVTDNNTNTPTSYDDNSWTCTDTNGDNSQEGMGNQVKSWLATH